MDEKLKFLGIKAAGRKDGNSEIILNELLKPAFEAGHEIEKINLEKYSIMHCTGCFGCNNKELECILKDDLKEVYSKIVEADAVTLAAPCYGIGAPSTLKTIIDRSAIVNMTNIVRKSKNRYGVAVSVGGGDPDWMSLQRVLPSLFLGFFNCDIIGQFSIMKTALKGEVLLTPSKLKDVRELGTLLLKSAEENYLFKSEMNDADNKLVCPNCYNDIFRIEHSKDGGFRGSEHYKCSVCNIKIDKFEKLDKLLHNFTKNPEKFGKSRFTVEETLAHFDHIGNKIISGIGYIEEINSRREKYLKEDIFNDDYISKSVEEVETGSSEWDEEAMKAFKQTVPRIFQGFVKKAVEQKAAKIGVKIITKDLFLKMKREAGF